MSLKAGSFAKVVIPAEDGIVTYTGKILAAGRNSELGGYDLDVPGVGTMHFPAEDNDRFKSARKPRGYKDSGATVVQKPKKVIKAARPGSKRDMVEDLVGQTPNLTRKEHIALVVEKIGMTPAGASTYVSGARKLHCIK